jgi:hypothetical protein
MGVVRLLRMGSGWRWWDLVCLCQIWSGWCSARVAGRCSFALKIQLSGAGGHYGSSTPSGWGCLRLLGWSSTAVASRVSALVEDRLDGLWMMKMKILSSSSACIRFCFACICTRSDLVSLLLLGEYKYFHQKKVT